MKTLALVCGLMMACVHCLPAQTIVAAEYFFDADPGVGNGTPLVVPAPGVQVTFTATISIATIQAGYHILYVRTRDSNAQWSLVELQEFVIEAPITELEYFFDLDPGVGNGTQLTIPANQLSLSGIISTALLSDGEHILFIRTRHEDEWSQLNPVAFYIHTRIVEAEYFIDADPGFGLASPFAVAVPSGQITETPSLNVGALSNGDHYLFVRTLDALGVWSFFEPVMFTVNDALPIELKDFTARATGDGRVNVEWTTLSEVNNDFFSVQHSTDGSEFAEFAKVKGVGTSAETHAYEQIHEQPARGINYYRLRQVDVNGRSALSEVVAVTIMGGGSFKVFPNPAVDEWFIDFSKTETKEKRLIELFDLTGRTCLKAEAETGGTVSFKRNDLAGGIYLLRISSPDGSTIVQKMDFR